ncbi:alpha/beta hydrolase, partial [Escherichia coli]|uniref:alpha/beta hydrolase n=1 Tax=Escherichia coli TaxID=562 RepID=UPI0028DFD0B0
KLINELISELPIDFQNVTLIGFSQGTILSYAVALSYPEKVKYVIALCGHVNTDLLVPGYGKNDFRHLNLFISHGTVHQVIPV